MTHSPIRKVFEGVADRRQMFLMFDRHERRPNRRRGDDIALYSGEWFEIAVDQHQYMFDILPPLWTEWDMFAFGRFCKGEANGVLFNLQIDGRKRYFHGFCDLSDRESPERMRDTIIARESRPVRAMTRDERLEHIWSTTHDDYRGYADWRFPRDQRGKRIVEVYRRDRTHDFKLLDRLTDAEIAAKLPVHLRSLPDAFAA